jgi:hypothetical protein
VTAVIRVYDKTGDVIETHEHAGEFKEPYAFRSITSHFPLKNEISMDPGEILRRAKRVSQGHARGDPGLMII